MQTKKTLTLLALFALALGLAALPALAAEEVVNVNDADAGQLALLPRVGPALAARIVEHRDENGKFSAPEDLMLVRGIGEVDDELVKSPAFNLVHEYRIAGRRPPLSVYHVDFYRLDALSEMDFLLFSEYFERPDAICLVEWASKFLRQLVAEYLSIALWPDPAGDPARRVIEVALVGATSAYDPLLHELQDHADAAA